MGELIDIRAADGGRFTGYMAVPAAGTGPGIVLCQEIFGVNATMRAVADSYAEEGYVVLVPDLFWRHAPGIELGYGEADCRRAFALYEGFSEDRGVEDVGAALAALRGRPECAGRTGVLGFCLGGTLAYLAACRLENVACAVAFYGVGIEKHLGELSRASGRVVLHIAADDDYCPPPAQRSIATAVAGRPRTEAYVYSGVGHAFARVGGQHFDKAAASLAHDRSIAALRREMGPHYELSALWDEHCACEFATRDVAATMATMVAEPYVNHIPTMTGGVGYEHLRRFYQHHFIDGNPPDTTLVPVSRTIGATQVVDEILFCFTHTREIDWMLPGIPPTGRRVEVPLVAVVKFRGDKLCHEHIYWDQASVLVQIGLLDPKGLPVAGVETARKLVDETLPSNTLMARWRESEGK